MSVIHISNRGKWRGFRQKEGKVSELPTQQQLDIARAHGLDGFGRTCNGHEPTLLEVQLGFTGLVKEPLRRTIEKVMMKGKGSKESG